MREPKDIFNTAGLDADKLELLEYLLEEEGIDAALQPDSILHVERTEALPLSYTEQQLPLSFAQQRLWFLHQFEPASSAYNMAGALRMVGQLDVHALSRSLDEIVRRHESLHTSFVSIGGKPVQVVAPASHLALAIEDLSVLPAAGREAELQRLMRREAREPFDLRESPLLRARLLRLSGEEYVLMLVMHHIVSDGWSLGIFARELAAIYGAYINGQPSPLEELSMQYADFAVWQREHLTGELLERQLDYWRRQLSGELPVLELPTGRPRPPVQTFRGATETFSIPLMLREELKELAIEEDATLFMVLLGAFQLLLWRYTQQRDILVGTPIAGRTRSELEPLIGCFVNTLVLRTRLMPEESFRELMRRVREVCLGGYAHQEVPFERVVEEIAPERSLSHAPLFQVMFALQNAPMPAGELPGLKLSLMEPDNEVATFDLSLEMMETPDGLKGLLHYNTDFFDAAMMARMAGHLRTLLEAVAVSADASIAHLPLLTETELR
ncbi:MAG TPA: condensation domain-containing protein, partial [Pyrinomonadaceae bacterium]